MTLLEILALLPLAFWGLLALDRRRAFPAEAFLPDVPAPPSREPAATAAAPSAVTAVVPARDEAAVLPETLPALLTQRGVSLSVVLVDDGSTDGTAQVARGVAAGTGGGAPLEVVPAPPAPPGWTGKVHALARGVEAAGEKPEWLVLTDADIRHRPGSLAALLAVAAEGPYDQVSVMARLHAATFWERLLIPPFVLFFQLLYPFRRVRSPRSRVAAAAGGCVLVRRAVLEAAGGVESIRGAVIDDVSLARQVQAAGGRLWLGFDPGIVSVRPYRGLGELWRMVARSAFVQLRHSWGLLALTLLGLAVFIAAPPFVAGAAGLAMLTAGPEPSLLRALAAALGAWGLSAWALAPYVRHHRVPRVYAFGLPFAGILYALMTATSAWDHLRGRGSRWKGRAYPRG
jgi:hopene-associated glycosyltransferase HpnB